MSELQSRIVVFGMKVSINWIGLKLLKKISFRRGEVPCMAHINANLTWILWLQVLFPRFPTYLSLSLSNWGEP